MEEYKSLCNKVLNFLHQKYGGEVAKPSLILTDFPVRHNMLGEGSSDDIVLHLYSFKERRLTAHRLTEAICHEYRHFIQWNTGMLDVMSNDDHYWKGRKIKNGDYDNPGKEYLSAPWEKDARNHERIYFKTLLKARVINPSKLNKKVKFNIF